MAAHKMYVAWIHLLASVFASSLTLGSCTCPYLFSLLVYFLWRPFCGEDDTFCLHLLKRSPNSLKYRSTFFGAFKNWPIYLSLSFLPPQQNWDYEEVKQQIDLAIDPVLGTNQYAPKKVCFFICISLNYVSCRFSLPILHEPATFSMISPVGQVHDWAGLIVEGVLKNLQQLGKPFKYVGEFCLIPVSSSGNGWKKTQTHSPLYYFSSHVYYYAKEWSWATHCKHLFLGC